MWNYYGSKSKISQYYPKPHHGKIIEPFAGTARYSLRYWQNEVLLVDKYEVVVKVWHWLQKCSPADIMGLPRLKKGQDITTLGLSEEETMFVGFLANIGQGTPSKTVTDFAAIQMGDDRKSKYKKVADQLHKIRHWDIRHGCYQELKNEKATWFIDPPYQFGGEHQYKHGNKGLDFDSLAQWCQTRHGQVIVCENTKATWLPFLPMRQLQGVANSNTVEAIWTNQPTSYGAIQTKLLL